MNTIFDIRMGRLYIINILVGIVECAIFSFLTFEAKIVVICTMTIMSLCIFLLIYHSYKLKSLKKDYKRITGQDPKAY